MDELGESDEGRRGGARTVVELVHSTSRAPAGWRVCVAGGAEEPRLARRVRSSKRRRHDASAAPRRRRAHAIRAALPSPARAAVPDRANAALSELVRTRSEVDVDEGGRSPRRARARCACRSRGSGRRQAHGRLSQSRQRRAAGVAVTTPDRRGDGDPHFWRDACLSGRPEPRPASMVARVSGDRTNSSASRRSSNRSVPSSSFRWSSVSTKRPGVDAVFARTLRRVSRYVCDTGRPTVCRPCRFRGGSIAVASDLGGLCRRRFEGPCQSCSELAAGQSLCPRAVPSATVADGLGGRDLCWPCCEGAWAARVGRGRSAARDASLSSALAEFGHARILVSIGRFASSDDW
jgi:hypothetical protein